MSRTELPKHLVVMAAGTGGHVIPGLAVAREMQARGWSVSWLGTHTGLENRLVPPTGLPMDTIAFSGLRGKGWRHSVGGMFKLVGSFWTCLSILRRRHAKAVLGMGGYVCVPGGIVSKLMRKPLVLVNADAALLLSNKALRPFAAFTAFGFDGPAARAATNAAVTGNPVRPEIENLPEPTVRFEGREGPLRLLVIGGSLGARVLNDCVPRALALMPGATRPHVLHQTGEANVHAVQGAYATLAAGAEAAGEAVPQTEVTAFIDRMATCLAHCDVVVCRAGAVTVSELCAAGVAAVLVPFIAGTTAHQRDNAEWLAQQGAGIHLPQSDLTPESLAALLAGLTRERLLGIASAARALARPQAAARVADHIERLAAA